MAAVYDMAGLCSMLAAVLLIAGAADARIVTESIEYTHGDAQLEGYLAYDDSIEGKRPGVLVVHEWWGLNDFTKQQARRLAQLGYVAFAADMYGKGRVTQDRQEAARMAGQFRQNPQLLVDRAKAALDVLRRQQRVDANRIGAIGFCFGGTTVVQLAYSGADVSGVVSFHGSLPAASDEQARRTRAAILALHGAKDTHVPPDDVVKFWNALDRSDTHWQLVVYADAKHSFMNPAAERAGMEGVGYDATAARLAWQEMENFFSRVFEGRGDATTTRPATGAAG